MEIAQSVLIGLAITAMIACAGSVFAWWKTSGLVTRLRSMSSLQGELLEIRDYCAKLDAWAKRINARDQRREEREQKSSGHAPGASGSEDLPTDRAALKNALRAKVGLLPGKPAPHA